MLDTLDMRLQAVFGRAPVFLQGRATESTDTATRWLWSAAWVHGLLAFVCLLGLTLPYDPVLGVHPLLKPLKFAISLALFLGAFAMILPTVVMSARGRVITSGVIVATMAIEMACIMLQGLRGRASHFNVATPLDAVIWELMRGAIVVASFTFVIVAIAASWRPLYRVSGAGASEAWASGPGSSGPGSSGPGPSGAQLSPSMTLAIRSGLWILIGAVVSGFAMGSRMSHSIGGVDGGQGLLLLGWSVQHGDLRVAHFVSLHAMQALPTFAWALEAARLGSPTARHGLVAFVTAAWTAVQFATFVIAALGCPIAAG
jgi:hypothetical protein